MSIPYFIGDEEVIPEFDSIELFPHSRDDLMLTVGINARAMIHGRFYTIDKITWRELKPVELWAPSQLTLTVDHSREFMNRLIGLGVRPSMETSDPMLIKALNAHIEDLRHMSTLLLHAELNGGLK